MKSRVLLAVTFIILLGVAGCGPSAETPRVEAPPVPLSKEGTLCSRAAMVDRPAGRQCGGVFPAVCGDGLVIPAAVARPRADAV